MNYDKELFFNCEYAGQKEDFKEIPNGYIDKTVCGCGLTSVALENQKDTIVAVPNVALVVNKMCQYPNDRYRGEVFGVYGGIGIDLIDDYACRMERTGHPLKIMVTFDSLWKVEHLLYKCQLIVDESDQLLKAIKLKLADRKDVSKKDVCSYLFDTAYRYRDSVSFISATPIPLKYMPSWIAELPQYKLHFSNTIKVTPILMERKQPFSALKDEVIRPLQKNGSVTVGDRTFSKVIVFLNSVENILKTVKECMLNKEDVAVLCANSVKNELSIRGYKRIDKPDSLPKYTFITSTGFQGIDLEDAEAMSIVVSNTTKDHQMINLLTDLKQATSRQRNKQNPNYDRFVYIYNQNNFKKTEDELTEIIDNVQRETEESCSLLNELIAKQDSRYTSTLKKFNHCSDFLTYSYFDEDTNTFGVNGKAFDADRYFILETKRQFRKGFDVISRFEVLPIVIKAPSKSSPFSYSALLEKYKASLTDNSITFTDEEKATEHYHTIDTYYQQYGTFTTNSTYANKMLKVTGNEWLKLYNEVRHELQVKRYTLKEVKEILNALYAKYGMQKKAKETDLYEFNIQFEKRKIKGVWHIDVLFKN